MAHKSTSEQSLLTQIETLKGALSDATSNLERERIKSLRAQEAKERADADRLRLQRARDDLAGRILSCERRAHEAEEEQLRVEQELQAEIRSLQSRVSEDASELSLQLEAESSAPDRHRLLEEVESERQRAAVLVTALNSAKRERDAALQKIAGLESERGRKDSEQPQEAKPSPAAPPEVDTSQLTSQISRLQAAQAKLLLELDEQNEETDRLSAENAALTQALIDARKLCIAWENQANDGLVQIDRLKDLLEESALWESPPRPVTQENGQVTERTAEAAAAVGNQQNLLENLEAQLVKEQARASQLDLHLRALAAEMTRTACVTTDVRNAALPLLSGIESRLNQVLKMTASTVEPSAG